MIPFRRCYRDIGNLIIVFNKPDAIFVSDGKTSYKVLRFWTERGAEQNKRWLYLRKRLKQNQLSSVDEVVRMARHSGFYAAPAKKWPDVSMCAPVHGAFYMKKIIIYTKYCFKCLFPEELVAIQRIASSNALELVIKRTAYNPLTHREAQGYRQDYSAFVVFAKKDYDIAEFIKKGEQNKLLGLSKTKRRTRVVSVVDAEDKAKTKDEEEEK